MADKKQEQIEISERLQMKLLKRWEKLLDSNDLQATDAATLARFLRENGWSVDPARLPTNLRDILTKGINPQDLADEDNDYGGGAH